jgi:L-iditol 2-dehydrogenase
MKAIVYYGPKDIRVEEREIPPCGNDELRVKVDACAVCGTDLKSYLVGNPRLKAPIVMGHEFTGLVETVGAELQGFEAGERVVMATSISCGECFYCGRGHGNLCTGIAPMGFSYDGGMAEYVKIPEPALRNGHVIKVPGHVQAEHAALAEPLSCAVNSCENCDVREGDTVVVIGAGPMGIMNAVVAREMGASKVILADINDVRLKQAKPFGFDLLVNPGEIDLTEVVKAETGDLGADVVIVAAPAAAPQEQAPGMVRKRGIVCLFASLPVGKSIVSLDSRVIHYGELRVVGTSDSRPEHVARAVDLIGAGACHVERLSTHVLELEGIFKAYDLMQSGEALRVVLVP